MASLFFFADARLAPQAALACLYFGAIASVPNEKRAGGVVALTLAGGLLFTRPPFPTVEDELHFWVSLVVALCMSIVALLRCDEDRGAEACVFALAGLGDAIYRTPENPYAPILCVILTIRQWSKVMRLCGMPSASSASGAIIMIDAVYLLMTTLYACVTI